MVKVLNPICSSSNSSNNSRGNDNGNGAKGEEGLGVEAEEEEGGMPEENGAGRNRDGRAAKPTAPPATTAAYCRAAAGTTGAARTGDSATAEAEAVTCVPAAGSTSRKAAAGLPRSATVQHRRRRRLA
jgi:hypothetical protein